MTSTGQWVNSSIGAHYCQLVNSTLVLNWRTDKRWNLGLLSSSSWKANQWHAINYSSTLAIGKWDRCWIIWLSASSGCHPILLYFRLSQAVSSACIPISNSGLMVLYLIIEMPEHPVKCITYIKTDRMSMSRTHTSTPICLTTEA